MSAAAEREALARRLRDAGLDWIVPQWDAPAGVRAFVTTRNGAAGVPFDVGGAHVAAGDAPIVAANRRRLQSFLPAAPVWLAQVHGTDVFEAGDAIPHSAPIADAAVTRNAATVVCVRFADCLPVLFAARDASVVGIAHAGWRGLARGVVERTLAAMRCDARDVVAWVGPGIGPTAFEVGRDVYEAFVGDDEETDAAFAPLRAGKWLADLEALARRRLAHAGVTSIGGGGMCTFSDPARYFSHRRDGPTGRMAAFLWREAR
jgi:purine-nucleoside/S-methyl-5'-thioadenosine phosphorylase / adenosine deaminase